MALNRAIQVWGNKIPFVGKGWFPFPIKVTVWQVYGEKFLRPVGKDFAKVTVEKGYQFCFLKGNTDAVFDLPPYKDYNEDGSIDLIRVGRGNFKPVFFTANTEILKLNELAEKDKIKGFVPFKINVVNDDGSSLNKILAVAHDIDLARNLHVAQSKSNYDRHGQKPDLLVQLAPYLTVLVTGLAIGIMYYLLTTNPQHVVVSVEGAVSLASPTPVLHPPI